MPSLMPGPSDTKEVVEHVTIARISKPTPSPTPKPTPTPVAPRQIALNNEGKQAMVSVIKRQGLNKPVPPKTVHTKPIWDILPSKSGAGAGAGLNNGAGSLGNGGNGSGTGNEGNGSGVGPCGAIDYNSQGDARYNPDTGMYERNNVIAFVHYPGRITHQVSLDWTWRYKSEADDPFTTNSSAKLYFQFPPVTQRANEPPDVQYIMRSSNAAGHVLLNDDPVQCPDIPTAPTAGP